MKFLAGWVTPRDHKVKFLTINFISEDVPSDHIVPESNNRPPYPQHRFLPSHTAWSADVLFWVNNQACCRIAIVNPQLCPPHIKTLMSNRFDQVCTQAKQEALKL